MFFERIKSIPSSNASAKGRVRKQPRQKQVLIVHPFVDDQAVLGAVLRRRGFKTQVAGDVQQALRCAGSESPDVIIIDENAACQPKMVSRLVDFTEQISCELFVLGKLPAFESRSKSWTEIPKPYHYDSLVRKISSTQRVRLAA